MRLTKAVMFVMTAALALGVAGCSEDEPTPEEACSPACGGSTPVCDEASKTCKTCTATQGCGADQVCDLTVAKGQCVDCTSDTHCDQATPICDTSINECVVCTALLGCASNQRCDETVAGGRCVAKGCTASSQCAATPATPVCNVGTGACVVCTATEGCTDGETCLDGVCIAPADCTASDDCSGETPVCDTEAGVCVICTATEGCEANESCVEGACVADGCDADADCTATTATPKCNVDTGLCVECVGEGDCESNESCTGNVCVPDGVDPSAQIATVRAEAATAGSTEATVSLPVQGAFVSYVKAANAAFGTSDPAGFMLQAVQAGPAIFVAVDPATTTPALVAGDKVSLTVTAVKIAGGLPYATAISGLSVISPAANNSLTGLVQDVNAVDLAAKLGDYELELVRATATLAGDFSGAGTGHSKAQITTAGVTTANSKVVVRLPTALKDTLNLGVGCSLTVNGFMWRNGDTAQLSAYDASEITGITCPPVKVVSAAASAATTVAVAFDMDLDVSSVLTNGTQFTIDGLAVSAAAAAGKVVTLTTASQTANTSYTVTVANTVKSSAGTAVGSSNTATFTGYDAGSAINVFFSEYVEGSSVNKAVEIYNAGGNISDLSVCAIKYYSNSASPAANTVALPQQALAAGETLVIYNSGASAAIIAAGDLANNTIANFNGDDTLELVCNSVTMDVFGVIGTDPGAGWANSDSSVSTVDMTLRRKCGITSGDTNGTDAFDPSVQWNAFAKDAADGLGAHSTVCR